MHERRRRERLLGRDALELPVRDRAQLPVEHRKHPIDRLAIAGLGRPQQRCDVLRTGAGVPPSGGAGTCPRMDGPIVADGTRGPFPGVSPRRGLDEGDPHAPHSVHWDCRFCWLLRSPRPRRIRSPRPPTPAPGSLRQAILDANASLGPDTIAFNIIGSGVHTIIPATLASADHGRRDDRRLHAAGLLAEHERGRPRAEHGPADRDRRHGTGGQRPRRRGRTA